jgi:hypothetical protein
MIAANSTVCYGSIQIRTNEALIDHRNLAMIEVVSRALLSIVIFQNHCLLIRRGIWIVVHSLWLLLRAQKSAPTVVKKGHILNALTNSCGVNYLVSTWPLMSRS